MLTPQEFTVIYSRYLSSGLSIRSFCQNECMCEAKFYYWKKKLRDFRPVTGGVGFTPLIIGDSGSSAISGPDSSLPESGFEICYPNGTRLRFSTEKVDMVLLRSLLSLQD